MKHLLTVLVFLLASDRLSAQYDSGSAVIYKDPRLNLLIKKQIQINEESVRNSRRNMPGYRIQIINTTDRDHAIDAKAKAYQLYPELKAYLLFQSPYYRIKVGNFKTRNEAEPYVRSLARDFNGTVFIVRDVIEVKNEIDLLN